jgi:hypothetical protein
MPKAAASGERSLPPPGKPNRPDERPRVADRSPPPRAVGAVKDGPAAEREPSTALASAVRSSGGDALSLHASALRELLNNGFIDSIRVPVRLSAMPLKDQLNSILDVFSRRQAPRGQGYKPDELSERLRNRILLLLREVFSGKWPADRWHSPGDYTREFWEDMHNKLQHLHGRPKLSPDPLALQPWEDVLGFALSCSASEFLDFVELTFRSSPMWRMLNDENELVDAINELFRIETAPYQLTRIVKVEEPNPIKAGPYGGGGTIIRTLAYPKVVRADDEVTHSEAIQPALSVLAAPHFEAANLEFRDALDEYRRGHYGDCVTKCCSSFESVMKSLCKRNKWSFDEKKDTAAPLLKIVLSHSKLDPFFEQPLLLIATMRNRLSSSHGGGTSVRNVERHVAQYAIASTAAAILLLAHEVGG